MSSLGEEGIFDFSNMGILKKDRREEEEGGANMGYGKKKKFSKGEKRRLHKRGFFYNKSDC